MSFSFEKDYLQDLEPVLVELEHSGQHDAVAQIAECKASGSTGGEILSCVNYTLRQTLLRDVPKELSQAIEAYLRKAPGY